MESPTPQLRFIHRKASLCKGFDEDASERLPELRSSDFERPRQQPYLDMVPAGEQGWGFAALPVKLYTPGIEAKEVKKLAILGPFRITLAQAEYFQSKGYYCAETLSDARIFADRENMQRFAEYCGWRRDGSLQNNSGWQLDMPDYDHGAGNSSTVMADGAPSSDIDSPRSKEVSSVLSAPLSSGRST